VALQRSVDAARPAETTAPAETTTSAAPTTTAPAPTVPAPTTTTTAAPRPRIERVVTETGFSPFATIESLVLHHPGPFVERVGFHQAGHDGARQMEPVATAARPLTLESRNRGTGDRTAADIVVQPGAEVRAPVTGTVIRGGQYTLYCDHVDEYLVIDPDGRPGWEVKLLHFEGLRVAKGQRVEAGVTVVGTQARQLPFASQIDELTAQPAWPHVHVEVVDPTIPDKPNPGGGGGCS
jgi:biotin carboxyl carrier protein